LKPADLSEGLRKTLRKLPKEARFSVGKVIRQTEENFGKVHLHSGLGLRSLIRNYHEVRVGLKLRLVFRNDEDVLSFLFIGNHDEVRRFLKQL